MKHQALIHSLYKIGAIKFGEFTLKSGKTSKIYLDLRQIVSHPAVLRSVGESIWTSISNPTFEMICGVPYTALPIATSISIQHNIPMVMRRKEKKDYGTKQMIEGAYKPGQQCLIIEDLVTTGSSVLETADELEACGLKIKDVAVLIDREQGGRENLQARHYTLHAAFTLKHVLHVLTYSNLLPDSEKAIVASLVQELA
jgi:orotate phosphoribosyltransferase